METLGISFVLPITKCDLDLSYQDKGILGAVGFLGIITSSHLWGFLADTNGRRKIITPTLFAGFFISVMSSLSPNFVCLVILRYLNGFLAMAVCISLMMGRIGSVVGTNVVGALIESHCQMALLLAGIFLLLGAGTSFLLPKGISSQKTQNTEEAT